MNVAPSQVSSQNIAFELDATSNTSSIPLNGANVRNLTNKVTFQTQVSYADCRWGINFFGGLIDPTGYSKQYESSPNLDGSADGFTTYDPPFAQFASASVQISFNSPAANNFQYRAASSGDTNPEAERVVNFVTSGANTNYTANLQLVSGGPLGGAATNTDVSLSVPQTWILSASQSGPGVTARTATGNLIIKSGGTTLITRPISWSCSATVG